VSLVLSGALTWVLVRDVELQGAQAELDRTVIVDAALVRHLECLNPVGVATNAGPVGCRLVDGGFFAERIASLAGADRLILLSRSRQIVYDSGGNTIDQPITIQPSKRVAGVAEATPTFDGRQYLAAAVAIQATRDPLGAAYVVVARAQSSVAAAAAGELVPRLLVAGGVALLVALVLVLLVSRSVTRPLSQLAGAAEDIAAGNYSRRVGIRGPDEIGLLGASFDRMAEGVEKARRVQRDFLANVSHELKTPLTSLIGFSQALIDGSLKTEAEQRRAAQIVHEESERVLRMAQELLDLARVEAGTMSLHITTVDLAGQLEQELEIVRRRAAARELTLTTDVAPDLPPVAADPERLHQVLGNLLDNAVKYAPDGTSVRIAARAEGASVELIVSNATGDHRPDPDRMFERFYRADVSRSVSAAGVGLGLAISRELTSAMKGRLWADYGVLGELRLRLQLPAQPARKPDPVPAGSTR
jgi:signal transduction histidine kinase